MLQALRLARRNRAAAARLGLLSVFALVMAAFVASALLFSGSTPANATTSLSCSSSSNQLTVTINGQTTSSSALTIGASGGDYTFQGPGITTTACSGGGIQTGTTVSPTAGTITLSQAAAKTDQGATLQFGTGGTAFTLTNVTTGAGSTIVTRPGGFPGVVTGMAVSGSGGSSSDIQNNTTVAAIPTDTLTTSASASASGTSSPTFSTSVSTITVSNVTVDSGFAEISASAFTGVAPNMLVFDTDECIQPNTTVTSVVSSESIDLSSDAVAGTSSDCSPDTSSDTLTFVPLADLSNSTTNLTDVGGFPAAVAGMTVSDSGGCLPTSPATTVSSYAWPSDTLTLSSKATGPNSAVSGGCDESTVSNVTVISGSSTVTAGSFGSIVPGMSVADSDGCVKNNTTVSQFDSGTETVTLSQAAQTGSGNVCQSPGGTSSDTLYFFIPTNDPSGHATTVTSGSTTLSFGSLITGVVPGMDVYDADGCIPYGTTVSAVAASPDTQLTLSNATVVSPFFGTDCSGAGTSEQVSFYDPETLSFSSTVNTSVSSVQTHNNQANVSASGGFPGVVSGMTVTDSAGCIPTAPATTVSSISSSTSLTLSANATCSQSSDTLTFFTQITTTSGTADLTSSGGAGGFPGVVDGMTVSGTDIATATVTQSPNSLALTSPAIESCLGTFTFATTVTNVALTNPVTLNGTASVTDDTGFPDVVPGMNVTGTSDIGGGTYVTYVSGDTVELNQPATGSTTESLTFTTPNAVTAESTEGSDDLNVVMSSTGSNAALAGGFPDATAGMTIDQTSGGTCLSGGATGYVASGGTADTETMSLPAQVSGTLNPSFEVTVNDICVSGTTMTATTGGSCTGPTLADGFPGVLQGMTVTGPGITGATTVSSVGGSSNGSEGNVLTLSSAVPTTSTASTFTFSMSVDNVTTTANVETITAPSFSDVLPGMEITGAFATSNTTVVVTAPSSGSNPSQYVVLDNSQGTLASKADGCSLSFDIELPAPSSGNDTLVLLGDMSTPAAGDDNVAVESFASGANLEQATLSDAVKPGPPTTPVCANPDVTVPVTASSPAGFSGSDAVQTIDVQGASTETNTLDLSLNSTGLTVNAGQDNGNNNSGSAGAVSGMPGSVPVEFSGEQVVEGSTDTNDFQPGSATGVTFEGEGSGANTLDLSQESSGSFTVQMTGGAGTCSQAPTAPGVLTSSGGITDCFTGLTAVNDAGGASAVATTFQPGTQSGVTFTGGSGVTNTLDLHTQPYGTASPDFGAFTVAMTGGSGLCSSSQGELTSTVTPITDCFTGVTSVNDSGGGSAVPTDFEPGTLTGVTFTGGTLTNAQLALGLTNSLDFHNESSSNFSGFTVAMTGAGVPCASSGGEISSSGSTSITDCFDGIGTVSDAGATTAVATDFQPGTQTGVTFTGGSGVTNTLDLKNESSFASFTVAMTGATGACATPGGELSTGGSFTDCFSGVTAVNDAGGSTTTPIDFQPGTETGVTFSGGSGVNNTVDLSQETVTNVGANASFAVSMIGTTPCSSSGGEVTSAGATPSSDDITDCFSNVSTVDQAVLPTSFQPGTTTGVTFGLASGDSTSEGTLDLSGENGSAHLTVDVKGNTNSPSSSEGTVAGTSSSGGALSDLFYGLTSVLGSPNGTTFQPGSSSVNFTGSGGAASNEVDLSLETSGSAGYSVAMNCASSSLIVPGASVTASGTNVTVSGGGFPGVFAGMVVSGPNAAGIPSGDTVSSVSGNTLVLTTAAAPTATSGTYTLSFVYSAVVAGATVSNSSADITVASGGFPGVVDGMHVSAPAAAGIPSTATVTSVSSGSNTLVMSVPATGTSGSYTVGFSSSAGCSTGEGRVLGAQTASPVELFNDLFSDVGEVNGTPTGVQTVFEPDPTLTSTPSPTPVFVGNNPTIDSSVVDLNGFTSSSITKVTAELNGDSSTSQGEVNATVTGNPVTFATFYRANEVVGSSGTQPTVFRPDLATNVDLVGQSPTDEIDLTNETSSSFGSSGSFGVQMSSDSSPCSSSEGQLASTGSTSIADCFTGILTVLGSPLQTTYDPPLSPASGTVPVFVGEDSSPGGSEVNLGQFNSVSGLNVAMNGDSSGSPSQVGATGPVGTFADFYNVNDVVASDNTNTRTDFEPGATSGVTFVGAGTVAGSGSYLDLSGESGAGSTVAVNGNSSASVGTVTGASLSDSYEGVAYVLGAQTGTVFEPSSTSSQAPTFVGACSEPNVVNLSGDSTAATVEDMTTGGMTEPMLPTNLADPGLYGACASADSDGQVVSAVTTSFLGVTEVEGSTTAGTTFQPGTSTNVQFVGQGSGITNTLDFTQGSSPVEQVSMNADSGSGLGGFYPCTATPPATPSCGSSDAGQGSFEGINAINGGTGGTAFVLGANGGSGGASGGITFTGAQSALSSNTIYLPSSSSALTVSVGSDTGATGSLEGLSASASFGNATTDSFSGIGVFNGSEEGSGGATFDATEVGPPGPVTAIKYIGGGSGTNTVSFATASASASTPLDVDIVTADEVSGYNYASLNGLAGTKIAEFTGVTNFVGCDSGTAACESTTLYAATGTTDNYSGLGSSNILDFSKVTGGSGVSVSVSSGAGNASVGGGSIGFSGIQTINGSPYTDTFTVGTGNATINGGGGSSTVTLAADQQGITFSLAYDQASAPATCADAVVPSEIATIVTASGTDCATDITTYKGSNSGENTFFSDGFGGHTFDAGGSGNTLSLGDTSLSNVTVNATGACAGSNDCVTGLNSNSEITASAASNEDVFSGFQTFDGAPKPGQTTFDSNGTNGLSFNGGNANDDILDLSTAPSGTEVQDGTVETGIGACNGSVISSGNSETFADVAEVKGSASGDTTFVVTGQSAVVGGCASASGSPPVTFVGQGSDNKLDSSALTSAPYLMMPTSLVSVGCVATAEATYPWILSGAGASDGCPATADELETFEDIQSFVGANTGDTTFVTGPSGGLDFTGQGEGNTLFFGDVPSSGGVQVFLNPTGGVETALPGSGTDDFTDLTTIDGSPGSDAFFGGPGNYTINGGGGPAELNDSGATNPVDVSMASGVGTVTGGFSGTTTTHNVQTFVGSSDGGNSFLSDSDLGFNFQVPGSTSGNTLSFANDSSNLSIGIDNTTGGGAATGTSASDSFQGFQNFVGATGTNAFTVGNGAYTLTGGGSSNSLSYSGPTGATVGITFNLTGGVETARSSNNDVDDTISGFTTITGAGVGGNDFEASAGGGYDLTGGGTSNNTLDLSAAPATISVTADGSAAQGEVTGLNTGVGPAPGDPSNKEDVVSGFEAINGSNSATTSNKTTFIVQCGGGQTFNGEGATGGSVLELVPSGCGTPTPTINATAGTLTGYGSTDDFTGITQFVGSTGGDTTFIAPGGSSGGYSFTGAGSTGNVFNASAFSTGSELNDANEVSGVASLGLSEQDTFSNVECFVGATVGGTDFVAPNSAVSTTGCGQPNFLGSGSANTLDLTNVAASSANTLMVTPPANPDGTVANNSGTLDTFAGIQNVLGSNEGNTEFVNSNVGGLGFTGQGNAATNTISFSQVPSSGGVQVSLDPNAEGQDTAQPGSGTDTFTGIENVTGSPGTDTFFGGPGTFDITGGGGTATLSYADASSPVTISLASKVASASGAFSGTTTASKMTTFIGSPGGGNSFSSDGAGSFNFEGPGGTSNNSLSFQPSTATGATVDITSSTGNGTASFTGASDNFQGFSSFTGTGAGGDTFEVGNGTYTLTGEGPAAEPNSVTFGTASTAVTVNLAEGVQTVASSSGSGVNDTISGFESITGANVGGNTFDAAAGGGYYFNPTPPVNAGGSNNILDLAAAPAGIQISSSGSSGNVTGLNTGVGPASGDPLNTEDVFQGFSTIEGSDGTTTFSPGCTGGVSYSALSSSSVLQVPNCGTPTTINATTSPGTLTGLSGGNDTFSGFTQFKGSAFGQTTFEAPGGSSGGYTFTAAASTTGNTFDASSFPSGAAINASTGTAQLALSESDSFANVQCFVGSSQGSTYFTAPAASLSATNCLSSRPDFLGSGAGNTLDLSNVVASGSSILSVTPSHGTVVSGANAWDSFGGIQSFLGSMSGDTKFINGTSGGVAMTGQGNALTNTITFGLVPSTGGVQVSLDPNSQGQETAQPGSGTDTFTGIDNVVGSNDGTDTYFGGPGTFNITGGGGASTLSYADTTTPVTISLDDGTATATNAFSGTTTTTKVTTFDGSADGGNTFDADAFGGYTFNGPESTTANTLSFAGVESGEGVTGVDVTVTSSSGNGLAKNLNSSVPVTGSGTDNFEGIQSYIGSNFSDDFTVGAGTFTLTGGSSGTNTLSYAPSEAGVTVDLAEPVATVTGGGGSVNDTISLFETIAGANVGDNVFDAGASGGYTLEGNGNGNTLNLSATPAGTTAVVNGDTTSSLGEVTRLSGSTSDAFAGMNAFIGSASASALSPTTFEASCTGNLSFTGGGRATVLDLASTASTSCAPAAPVVNDTTTPGTVSGLTGGQDTFSDITSFGGPSSGETTFMAPGVGTSGLTFSGGGTGNNGNTFDASAFPTGSTLDANAGKAFLGSSSFDFISGMSCFVGSNAGGTTFRAPSTALSGSLCQEFPPNQPTYLATGTGNTLDLSAVPITGVVACVSGGNVTVAATSCGAGTSFGTYVAIQSFIGSSEGNTTFVAAPGGGQSFTGAIGTGSTNTLSIPAAPRGTLVDTTSSTVTLGGSTGTLDFSNVDRFIGATGGFTTFKPDALGSYTFAGVPSTFGNTLDLSNAPTDLAVDLACTKPLGAGLFESWLVMPPGTPSCTAPPASGAVDQFSGIESLIGSASGDTTFTAPATALNEAAPLPSGGLSFTGQSGTQNSLTFSQVPVGAPGVTVDLLHGLVASTAFTNDDTFTGMQTIGGTPNADNFLGGPVTMTINGNGGSDTLSFADGNAAANVTLANGSANGVATGGFVSSPAQLTLTGIQNVVSSPFGGTITGNTLPSVFTGGAGPSDFVVLGGSDVIDGGGGTNTLDLSHATKFVTLNLGLSGPQVTGGAGILTIVPGTISDVIGGNFDNRLIAGAGNVTLNGGIGSDFLQAGSGTDTLNAGSGTTTLVGGTGYDTMNGGAGTDKFIPGSGGGKITDTAGVGTIDYALATSTVYVNIGTSQYTAPNGTTVLSAEQASGACVGCADQTLVGLTNIIGPTSSTVNGNILVGSTGSNTIQAGNGTNLIVGDGGNDLLTSGTGSNRFVTGPGDNTVQGGSGTNTIDYLSAPAAVNVDLAAGTAKQNGWGGTDTLSGITNIIGSNNNKDVLELGTKAGGEIIAGSGEGDSLIGSKAGGSTLLAGGGTDSLSSLGPNDHLIGGAASDTFLADNGYVDYLVAGGGYNTANVDCLDIKDKTLTGTFQVINLPAGGCTASAGGGKPTPPSKPLKPTKKPLIPAKGGVHKGTPVTHEAPGKTTKVSGKGTRPSSPSPSKPSSPISHSKGAAQATVGGTPEAVTPASASRRSARVVGYRGEGP
jgi:hypothetical protein